jgi:NADH-quinone oxidoreductase subunit L
MLDSAWIIPALPAVSFLVILFFGKRLPKQGAWVGILAVGTSFVLSVVTTVEWINRVNDANSGEHGLSAFFGKAFLAAGGGEHSAAVAPVIHAGKWWQSGGVSFGVGT